MHPLEDVLENYTLRATCVGDHVRLVQAKPLTNRAPLTQRAELLSRAFYGIIKQNKHGEYEADNPTKGLPPEGVADAWVYTGRVYTLMKKDCLLALFYDPATTKVTEIGANSIEDLKRKVENREFENELFNGTVPSVLRG